MQIPGSPAPYRRHACTLETKHLVGQAPGLPLAPLATALGTGFHDHPATPPTGRTRLLYRKEALLKSNLAIATTVMTTDGGRPLLRTGPVANRTGYPGRDVDFN